MKLYLSQSIKLIKIAMMVIACCSPLKASEKVHNGPSSFAVHYCSPLSVVTSIAAPIVTAYASPKTATLYNILNLTSPLINNWVSSEMLGHHLNTSKTGAREVYFSSPFKKVLTSLIGIAAVYSSYSYESTTEPYYKTFALASTTINAVITSVNTLLVYYLCYDKWTEKQKEKQKEDINWPLITFCFLIWCSLHQ